MVSIRKVEIAEADALLAFSKETFYEFFARPNDPADMEAYAALAFTRECMLNQLTNPDSEFYFALNEDEIMGYIKLNFNNAQTEFKDKNGLEIERIYVSGEHHGRHIGRQMLDFAFEIARSKQLAYVWLGVWEYNTKAIGFYEHCGFEIFSSHEFLLGNDRQTDLLMKRPL